MDMQSQDNLEIRKLKLDEIGEALHIIWEVFQEFVAPDYTQEGIDNFYIEYIQGEWFREKFKEGKEVMYGAFVDNILVGVLSISEKNTVSCVFVKGNYHGMGIGKKLFNKVLHQLRNRGVERIKLNASPYAVPFYHHIGFKDTDMQSSYKGIVYTPMELVIGEQSL